MEFGNSLIHRIIYFWIAFFVDNLKVGINEKLSNIMENYINREGKEDRMACALGSFLGLKLRKWKGASHENRQFHCSSKIRYNCQSLKDLRVSVPLAIRKGETAVLLCDFDLEGDSLYSVKWYKGRREFYRFTPKDEFPIKTFPIERIPIEKLIDKSKSNMTQLTLVDVDPSLSGVYNCEVSAESPSFHTELKSGEMNVVEVPYQNPRILGLKQRYSIGEMLEGVCISGASRPATNLTWFINGEKISKDHVFASTTAKDGKELIITKSRLKIIVKTHSFINGRLKVRCQAMIHYVYNQSVEQDILEERSRADQETTQVVILPSNFLEKTQDKTGKRNFEDFDGSMARKVEQFEALEIVVSLLLIHDLFR